MMGDKGGAQMTDAVDEPTQKLATNDIPGSSQNILHNGLQACGSDNDSSCADKTPDSEPPTQSIFTDTAPTGPYVTAELAQPLPMPLSKLLENTAVVRSELSLALTDQSIDTLPSFETAGSSCVVTPNRSMGVASYQTAVSQQSSPDGMLFPITEQPVPFLCPPGLEGLLDTGQLVIHKDNLRRNKEFNSDALRRYEVVDISRKVVFHVEKEKPPINNDSFLYKFYSSNKECMQLYLPSSKTCVLCHASWHCLRKCCHFQPLLFAPLGHIAGFIRRSHNLFVQEYLIMNSHEEVLLILRGGPIDLEIYSPNMEDELGRLSVHGWHGIMHEIRRSSQDYGLTFPLDLDVRVKAVLLGAVFAIDWVLYDQK